MCFRCRLNCKTTNTELSKRLSVRFAFSSGICRPGEEDKKTELWSERHVAFIRADSRGNRSILILRNSHIVRQFSDEMGCTVVSELCFKLFWRSAVSTANQIIFLGTRRITTFRTREQRYIWYLFTLCYVPVSWMDPSCALHFGYEPKRLLVFAIIP